MRTAKLYLILALTGLYGIPAAMAQSGNCVTGDGKAQSIVYKVDGQTVAALNGNVKSGSKVQVTFRVAGSSKTRFSLVSYTAPAPGFSYETADQERVYMSDSRELTAGNTYTFTVRVPDCYFQVDFVKGCVIEQFGPENTNNFYGRQDRLIASANGGDHYCSAKDKEHGYGNNTGNTEDNTGSCQCDNDGDGKADANFGSTNYNDSKTIKAQFSADGKQVVVTSTDKDISNIVVKYDGAPDYKYDNLTGKSYTVTSDQYTILGVWVKAGDNASGDGPGYGEFIENLNSSENPDQCTCGDDQDHAGAGNSDTPKKVTICHIPPGNPDNAHTITISENAWKAHHENHGDYMGECRDTTTPPPADTTCPCDYDGDGKNDRIYGSLYTSIDGSYAARFTANNDSALVMSETETITDVTIYFEDGSVATFTDVNTTSKWYSYPFQVIMAVEINGNLIENLAALDPDVICDCMPDEPGEPVPVSLIKFEGKKIAPNVVSLEWETASEVNNDYMAIEKSIDINTWREVCRVPGHGTTNDPHSYSCVDNNANEDGQNLVYYRPKQVDLNGAYEYFDMIHIRLQDAAYASSVSNVYPNPTTGQLYVTYNASENGVFNIRLLSVDGKALLTTSFVAKAGEQTTDINLAEKQLKPGLYVLEVKSENQVFRQKVYKQ
jgi:hypothetical protein